MGATFYIPGLDGLRAIAITTVFIGHCFPSIVANSVGVDIFFTLSGFLITRGLKEQIKSGGIDLRQFYFRRVLRLAPALFLLVSVVVLIATMKLKFDDRFREHILSSAAAITYTMNWSRAFSLGHEGWLGHTWSLAIEEQFYLIWPLLLMGLWRFKNPERYVILLAAFSLATRIYLLDHGSGEDRIYNGFDTRADGLLIGCAMALARPFGIAAMAAWTSFIPILIIALIFCFVPWISAWTLSSTVISLASAWLILPLWSGNAPRMSRALEFSPIRYVGRISYGLYLWHWPVLSILLRAGLAQNSFITALAAAVTTLAVASLSFHFVELPFLKRGRPRPIKASASPEH